MFKTLNERQTKAEQTEIQLAAAKKAQESAGQLRDQKIAEAKKEAETLYAEARKDANTFRAENLHKVEKEITEMKERTEKELVLARERMISEAREQLVDIALLAAEKVLERSVRTEDSERLARKAIAVMQQRTSP